MINITWIPDGAHWKVSRETKHAIEDMVANAVDRHTTVSNELQALRTRIAQDVRAADATLRQVAGRCREAGNESDAELLLRTAGTLACLHFDAATTQPITTNEGGDLPAPEEK
jgi:hypothetical protein